MPKDRPIANFEEVIDFDDDDEDDLVAALGGTPKEKPKKVKRYDTAIGAFRATSSSFFPRLA